MRLFLRREITKKARAFFQVTYPDGSAVPGNEKPTRKDPGDKEAPRGKTKGKAHSACEKEPGEHEAAPELGSGSGGRWRRRGVKFVVG